MARLCPATIKVIHSREDFSSRFFPFDRPRHESDCQAMCNLLSHMQQKVVMNLVAAFPRCVFFRLRQLRRDKGVKTEG